ncbi:MAG: Gfo/Idh/MocA family oxidoreductase [Flavobacteriales bacterium]|nr:Gfo/Idh/MocA family oxidoreductase [Flavobacteriales bacterium]
MSEEKIKFAVLGCGHIGKRHMEMIRRHPEAELVAGADIRTREECGIDDDDLPIYDSLENMLNSGKDFDVVNICTPNGLHAENAMDALEGKKHIVCEKPMALKKLNCEKIISKGLNLSKQVFCVMQNRYSPPSVWIKDVIENKLLGEIFLVQLNCYWNRDDRYYKKDGWKGRADMDGGTLFTQFSHFIDLMYWLFGDIENIQGKFNNCSHEGIIDFEDTGVINFDFLEEGMGSLNYSTSIWDTNFESSITIIGSNGTVRLGGQYMNKVDYCHIKDYTMPELAEGNPSNNYGGYQGSAANHNYVIQNVIDTLKGRKSIATNSLEGLKVVDIIERIYQLK